MLDRFRFHAARLLFGTRAKSMLMGRVRRINAQRRDATSTYRGTANDVAEAQLWIAPRKLKDPSSKQDA
jgi:hypothetical protein